ncbi:Hms1 protein [Martiniozyma asiatica (nom. inval.)]|nr:Hms1 protein [Martiniozyma asiatica]
MASIQAWQPAQGGSPDIKSESSGVSPFSHNEQASSFSGSTSPKSPKPLKHHTVPKRPKRDRSMHNKIEKKYRTNINVRIIELRDAVPTLRAADPNSNINLDQLDGLTPASKLNKASILSKATEYIKHLEAKNASLLNELKYFRSAQSSSNNNNNNNNNDNNNINNINNNNTSNKNTNSDTRPSIYSDYDSPIEAVNYFPVHRMSQGVVDMSSKLPQPQQHQPQLTPSILPQQQPVDIVNNSFQPPLYEQDHILYGQDHMAQPQTYETVYDNMEYIPVVGQQAEENMNMPHFNQVQYPVMMTSYPEQSNRLSRNIMLGGMATVFGAQFLGGQDGNFKGLSVLPLGFTNNVLFARGINFLQLITILAGIWTFLEPYLHSKDIKKTINNKSLVTINSNLNSDLNKGALNFLFASLLNSIFGNLTSEEISLSNLANLPTSTYGRLILYIRLNYSTNISEVNVPSEVVFNKLFLISLIINKSSLISNILGLKKAAVGIYQKMLQVDSLSHANAKIVNFLKIEQESIGHSGSFVNFTTINDVDLILSSLANTKSAKKTISNLFGSNVGHNSICEYLIKTPIYKMKIFDLVCLTKIVKNRREELVQFLNDSIQEANGIFENIENGQFENIVAPNLFIAEERRNIVKHLSFIESYIPISCIKLIKCCKIFKCLLEPTSETFLNDALNSILLSVEMNLNCLNNSDQIQGKKILLDVLKNDNLSILAKVIEVIQITQSIQNSNIFLSDENRLSLVCSLILHYYSIDKFDIGMGLIEYLKREKSNKFACGDSISLMCTIATFKTIVMILSDERLKSIKALSESISSIEELSTINIITNDNYNYNRSDDYHSIDSDHTAIDNDDIEHEINDNYYLDVSDDEYTWNRFDDPFTRTLSKQHLSFNDKNVLEDLVCGMRIYLGQGISNDKNADEDILKLHYGIKSDFSDCLLTLAKHLVGYENV